jgi:transcription termination factor Rho
VAAPHREDRSPELPLFSAPAPSPTVETPAPRGDRPLRDPRQPREQQEPKEPKEGRENSDSGDARPEARSGERSERSGDGNDGRPRRNRGPRQRRRKGNRESHGSDSGPRRDQQSQSHENRDKPRRNDSGQEGNRADDRRDDTQDDRDHDPRELIIQESSDDRDKDRDSDQGGGDNRHQNKTRKQRYLERKEKERAREAEALESSPAIESEGIVEISPKGFGFLREKIRGFQQSPKDVFITPEVVRIYGLRDGLMVRCISKHGVRGPQLIELLTINDRPPEECAKLPYFEELTAINPNKKLTLETQSNRATTRVIDLMAPIGRGQRGLIVAPPRTGKTTLLHHIAEGILHNYEDEIHLMVLLVDERPEEVTDFERSFPNVEVFSSSNDSEAKDHTRIALLAIERAKRLVEGGRHVVMLMDSITRLARAFNSQMRGGKRGTASGGLIVGALEVPRRIFAAARNTREAGSLTIIATALIQTNSKADEAIFQEFKGTGNMELVLDRQIAQNYVYPAVDINKSGTRREELLLPPHVLEKIYVIRRGLSGYKQVDAMEWLLKCMQRYPSNAQMLMDIKTTALS